MIPGDKVVTTRSNSRATMLEPSQSAEATVNKHVKSKSGNITADVLVAIVKEQNSSFEKAIEKAIAGLSDKLDNWRTDIIGRVSAAEKKITEIEEKLELKIKKFEERIDSAIRDLQHRAKLSNNLHMSSLLKINDREQRARGNSVKVSYYLDLSADSPPTAKDVFNKLIMPALMDAKEAGRLAWLPDCMERIIEVGHILPLRQNSPPSFQFAFISRSAMHAYLDFRRPYLDELNKTNEERQPSLRQAVINGTRRPCKSGADLTTLNRQLMTFLHGQKGVGGVKLSGTRVLFSRLGIKGWNFACNPFGRTLAECTSVPFDTFSILRELIAPKPLPPFLKTNPRERFLSYESEKEDLIKAAEEMRMLRESADGPEERSVGEVVREVEEDEAVVDNPSDATSSNPLLTGMPGIGGESSEPEEETREPGAPQPTDEESAVDTATAASGD
jgi:hypothetical protein